MSWETHKEQSQAGSSDFPPVAEKAKAGLKSLQTAIAALRSEFAREKNSKSVHEKFALLRQQAADCSAAIRMLGQTQAYTAYERQTRSRTISSLTGQLQEELRKIENLAYELAAGDKIDIAESERPRDFEEEKEDESQAFEEALLRDRREELANVESSMSDIKNMIADAAKLVRDQGELLDRIDVNIGDTVENTGKATKELHTAERRQKTKRALICIIIFGLLVVIVVVVVLVTQTK